MMERGPKLVGSPVPASGWGEVSLESDLLIFVVGADRKDCEEMERATYPALLRDFASALILLWRGRRRRWICDRVSDISSLFQTKSTNQRPDHVPWLGNLPPSRTYFARHRLGNAAVSYFSAFTDFFSRLGLLSLALYSLRTWSAPGKASSSEVSQHAPPSPSAIHSKS